MRERHFHQSLSGLNPVEYSFFPNSHPFPLAVFSLIALSFVSTKIRINAAAVSPVSLSALDTISQTETKNQ
ncbi:hypothetical protein TRIATDRAFT_300183 [Trichoderma atroviride IMI 206040]|uniref:Uncharacterized protein n=1 Tax=Hypocrea atroviridis (strain ATCC 20476 / IMI 206040) TaxID=452589 RepID=G9NYV7_HYPAI|nr:uncharacterized protein TRIATDRAFT_300183 [Trichoderma atroviride IMI 206040]EHK43727.1 hypothetical protein TRIATDRAFT_300183 [Trichoderma atroviride IMI 206040]